MVDAPAEELLFIYGTLQLDQVQRETFGRLIAGEDDALPGFTIDYSDTDEPRVAEPAAAEIHPVLRRTGNPLDKVMGRALRLTEDELDAADEYEAERYRRARVTLASGRPAWVYLPA